MRAANSNRTKGPAERGQISGLVARWCFVFLDLAYERGY